jgi:hypothetical protein
MGWRQGVDGGLRASSIDRRHAALNGTEAASRAGSTRSEIVLTWHHHHPLLSAASASVHCSRALLGRQAI